MKLADLKTYLTAAASGVDVQDVYFDFLYFMNSKTGKNYPLVIWDIANLSGQEKALDGSTIPDKFSIDIYAINIVTPESDLGDDRLIEWDEIEEDLKLYLLAVNSYEVGGRERISILNKNAIEQFEYYPASFFSVDRELGVRYNVTLKLWC